MGQVNDRESPSYRLMEKLEALGATVSYHDPYIPTIRPTREFPQFAGRKSSEINNGYDLIIIATPHDAFREINFESFRLPVVDTRNVVVTKGMMYYPA